MGEAIRNGAEEVLGVPRRRIRCRADLSVRVLLVNPVARSPLGCVRQDEEQKPMARPGAALSRMLHTGRNRPLH
jgi:hypothetical protein